METPLKGKYTVRKIAPIFLVLLSIVGGACSEGKPRLKLATTTSFENSGLLKEMLPRFEQACECRLHTVVVGTGQALKLGANGDVDLVVVHAPALDAGLGIVNAFGSGVDTVDVRLMNPTAAPIAPAPGQPLVFVLLGAGGPLAEEVLGVDLSGSIYTFLATGF